jgi:hypothetical protein
MGPSECVLGTILPGDVYFNFGGLLLVPVTSLMPFFIAQVTKGCAQAQGVAQHFIILNTSTLLTNFK